jgi:ATP-dependent DNA helicase RecG
MTEQKNPPTADRLHDLIKAGRSTTLDWIEDQADLKYMQTVLAGMANNQGGTLLVGVKEDEFVGVASDVKAIDHILQAALSLSPSLIIPLPRVHELDEEKHVLEVTLPAGMPHVYADEGRYVIRKGTQTVPLEPEALRRLFIQRGAISFEGEITPGATLDDIAWEKVEKYTEKLGGIAENDPKEILLRRGCLTRQHDDLHPTNAGILLFGKDPQRFVRGAEITAVRFAGETMSDTFSRADLTGTLPDQINRAQTFLVDHLRKETVLKKAMAREERYEYPMEAAREVLINAVAHRDYSISGDGIRLFVFKNHMEVTSPGGLAGPVTIANIKDERFSRNPIIVQVLSDLGYIERLGYGVDRVIKLMRSHQLETPDFKETNGGFKVTFRKQQETVEKPPPAKPKEAAPKKEDAQPEILLQYKDVPINPRQEGALVYLSQPGNTRITNSELQRMYPDVHAETIRRDLADLVTKDILSKMGQKRGSYYVLRTEDAPA